MSSTEEREGFGSCAEAEKKKVQQNEWEVLPLVREVLNKRHVRRHLVFRAEPSPHVLLLPQSPFQACSRIWGIQVVLTCTVVNEGISLSWNLQIFIFLSASEAFPSGYVAPETRKDSVHCTFLQNQGVFCPLGSVWAPFFFFFQIVVMVLLLWDTVSPVPCLSCSSVWWVRTNAPDAKCGLALGVTGIKKCETSPWGECKCCTHF